MVKLIAIVVLLALLFVLLRYRTREEIQRGVVITIGGAFVFYLVTVFVMELMH